VSHDQCDARRPTITFPAAGRLLDCRTVGLEFFAHLSLLAASLCNMCSRFYAQLVHVKSREIPREFDLTAVQGHPRSSILMSIESPYATSY